jgi:hypothetical protein
LSEAQPKNAFIPLPQSGNYFMALISHAHNTRSI